MKYLLVRQVAAFLLLILGIPSIWDRFQSTLDWLGWFSTGLTVVLVVVGLAGLLRAYYSPILGRFLMGVGVLGLLSTIGTLVLIMWGVGYPFDVVSFFSPYLSGVILSGILFFSGSLMTSRSAQEEDSPELDLDGNPLRVHQPHYIFIIVVGLAAGLLIILFGTVQLGTSHEIIVGQSLPIFPYPTFTEEMGFCTQDSDCVKVPTSCDCAWNVQSINKKFSEEWESNMNNYCATRQNLDEYSSCINMTGLTGDLTPACVNNQCVFLG